MFIKYALMSFLFLQGEVLQHQHVVAADSDIKEDISHPGDISFVSTTESSHQDRHLDSIWIPDCSKNKHKDRPQCKCRFPTNYDEEICINWRKKIETKNNVSNEPNKIVGGENAPVDKYPWFARLTNRNGSWAGCGGMLVAPEYVLTAAHCVAPNTSWSANQAAVQIGAVCPNSGNNCGQPKQQINVASITPHPQYSGNTLNNDFALVKLASRANAAPVAMDQGDFVDNYSASKRNIYAIGLGTLSSGGSTASQLRHVELAFVPRNTCNNSYSGGITENMMCAADPNQDSCQGDSGGPLYDDDNNVLIGVVSWGYGCADPQYPGVYAQVSAKWSWIKSTICDNHSTPKPDYCSDSPTPPTPTPPTPTPPTPTPPTPPTPTPPTPTPPTGCSSGELAVEIDITTDIYPQETIFSIEKSTNGLIEEVEYEFDENTEHNYDYCLDSSICHKFTIYDSYGDGILAPGGFSLTVDNVEKLSTPNPRDFFDLSVEFGDCDNNTGGSCDYDRRGPCRRDPACFWRFGECYEFLGGCEDYTTKFDCKSNGCKWKKVAGSRKKKCFNP